MTTLPRIAALLGIAGALLNASAPHAAAIAEWVQATTPAMVLAAQGCWAAGNALWLVYAIHTRQAPLGWQYAAFLAISSWGLWSWWRA